MAQNGWFTLPLCDTMDEWYQKHQLIKTLDDLTIDKSTLVIHFRISFPATICTDHSTNSGILNVYYSKIGIKLTFIVQQIQNWWEISIPLIWTKTKNRLFNPKNCASQNLSFHLQLPLIDYFRSLDIIMNDDVIMKLISTIIFFQ